MLWFRHVTKEDPEIRLLMIRYGVMGYGFYFNIVQRIAAQLTSQNICFELEDEDEVLANDFKLTIDQVREIKKYCIDRELFELNPETGNISCLTLIKYLDHATSYSPEIKKLRASKDYKKLVEHYKSLKNPEKVCKEFSATEKVFPQRRGEERREDITTTIWSEKFKFLRLVRMKDPETGDEFDVEIYASDHKNPTLVYSRFPGSPDAPYPLMTKDEFQNFYPEPVVVEPEALAQ